MIAAGDTGSGPRADDQQGTFNSQRLGVDGVKLAVIGGELGKVGIDGRAFMP